MTVEFASPGTLSDDATLPSVVRIFIYADATQRAAAAERVRAVLGELLPDSGAEVHEDVMPPSPTLEALAESWARANPGADPGPRRHQRITVVVPGLGHAELADLSVPLADAVSPGWRTGRAAERAVAEGHLPCRVAVGRADEHPGEPPIRYREEQS